MQLNLTNNFISISICTKVNELQSYVRQLDVEQGNHLSCSYHEDVKVSLILKVVSHKKVDIFYYHNMNEYLQHHEPFEENKKHAKDHTDLLEIAGNHISLYSRKMNKN